MCKIYGLGLLVIYRGGEILSFVEIVEYEVMNVG